VSPSCDADQLLSEAVAGDHAALERLLLAHYDHVLARINRLLPDDLRSQLSEDVLQETFVQAFRDIAAFAPTGEQAFRAWLETIAEHRAQDAVRRAGRKKRGGDFRRAGDVAGASGSQWLPLVELLGTDASTPSQFAARHEAIQAVQVGVSALPDEQRDAIRMHCLERLSLEETAQAMNRSPGAIRGLVHRGKTALRACLVRSSLWLSKR
jgi:RNA polymerase sigma-70 factor (ECF subfamily)